MRELTEWYPGHADAKMTRRYLRDRTVPVVEPPRFRGRK